MKNAGIKSYGSAREKISAQGTSTTASGKAKPPPPPPPPPHRRASSLSNQRSSFVSQVSATPSGTTDVEEIDWANLSVEDKQAFFAWLDEFFARYLDGPPPSNVHSVPISTKGPASTTPLAPARRTPSLPSRSSRASQDTGPDRPDPQDEVAPSAQAASSAGRRNLPPLLSQQGPVRPHSCVCHQNILRLCTAKDQI